jgi:hypothetical protein
MPSTATGPDAELVPLTARVLPHALPVTLTAAIEFGQPLVPAGPTTLTLAPPPVPSGPVPQSPTQAALAGLVADTDKPFVLDGPATLTPTVLPDEIPVPLTPTRPFAVAPVALAPITSPLDAPVPVTPMALPVEDPVLVTATPQSLVGPPFETHTVLPLAPSPAVPTLAMPAGSATV